MNKEAHRAVSTIRVALRQPVHVQVETVNRSSLTAELVADKFLGGDRQLFPLKHLLKIGAGIAFLEMNVDFHQPTCAGYEYSKSHFIL
jgi:hypothetical protein